MKSGDKVLKAHLNSFIVTHEKKTAMTELGRPKGAGSSTRERQQKGTTEKTLLTRPHQLDSPASGTNSRATPVGWLVSGEQYLK